MKNIYIEIEVYQREFESRFLIGLQLAKLGFKVYLASRNEIFFNAFSDKLSPGILHLKDINSTNVHLGYLDILKKKGFILTSQDEESGVLFDNLNDFISRRTINSKVFNYIDAFFCWGERDYKFMCSLFPQFKDKFFLSGSPKFDLCKKESFFINSKKFKKRNKIKNNYILISSNISFPLSLRRMVDRLLMLRSENNKATSEFIEKFFFNTESQNVIILSQYISLIRHLLENTDEYDIVLRPHPNETVDDWIKLLDLKNDRLHIIKEGDLSDFVRYSNFLIHNGCTASIHAALLKKRIISFEPNNFNINFFRNFPNSLGYSAKNKDDVINLINSSIEPMPFSDDFKNRIYNYRDDSKSFIYISNIIEKLSKKIVHKKNKNFKKNIFKSSIKNFLMFFVKKLNLNKIHTINDHKFPDFKYYKVNEVFEKINYNKDFNGVNFKVLNKKILLIEKVTKQN